MGSKPGGSPTPGQAELVKFPPPSPRRRLQTSLPLVGSRESTGRGWSTCFHRESSQGLGSLPSGKAGKTGISSPSWCFCYQDSWTLDTTTLITACS